jgi:outer membrane receptor protein involved in Fe transport
MKYGIYLQDEWHLTKHLIVNYGARHDYVDAFVQEGRLSPRLGVVYKIFEQTTLHAGYARYFTPPPTELVASKDLTLFQNTVNSPGALGNSTANGLVKSERDHYYDAGISQALTPDRWAY